MRCAMRSALVFTVTKVGGGVVRPTDVLSPGESYTIKVRASITLILGILGIWGASHIPTARS